jgi:CRISPR system Cascade subunit CasE
MFASVINLNFKAIKELKAKDHYSLHRIVYDQFEDISENMEQREGRLLWHDEGLDENGRRILVLSDRAPKMSDPYSSIEVLTKEISEEYLRYESYSFTIRLNATTQCSKSRKRLPVKSDNVIDWLNNQGEKSGFVISKDYCSIEKSGVLKFKGKNSNIITFNDVTISGQMSVTNHDEFKRTFLKGIGRGKSFGFGMLRVKPIK